MKKSESDEQKLSKPKDNAADRLCRIARLEAAWGRYEGRERENGLPEVHIVLSGDTAGDKTPVLHTWESQCWCEPYIEFATAHVVIYRHRRIN